MLTLLTWIRSCSGTGCWLRHRREESAREGSSARRQTRGPCAASPGQRDSQPSLQLGKPRLERGAESGLGPRAGGGREGNVLAMQGGGAAPLGLLHHGGLVAQGDADARGCELAGLAIHLHWDGLGRGEHHLSALRQPLAVPAHLQCRLWVQKVQVRSWGRGSGAPSSVPRTDAVAREQATITPTDSRGRIRPQSERGGESGE